MTGLDRNADVVSMATYAPLFAHKDAWQWKPDLIWFDNRTHVLTPNYYVQQMYSAYAGNRMLPLTGEDGKALAGQNGIYGSAVVDEGRNSVVVKLVNMNPSAYVVQLGFNGKHIRIRNGSETGALLHSDDMEAQNSSEFSDRIRPVSVLLPAMKNGQIRFQFPAYSRGIYILPAVFANK